MYLFLFYLILLFISIERNHSAISQRIERFYFDPNNQLICFSFSFFILFSHLLMNSFTYSIINSFVSMSMLFSSIINNYYYLSFWLILNIINHNYTSHSYQIHYLFILIFSLSPFLLKIPFSTKNCTVITHYNTYYTKYWLYTWHNVHHSPTTNQIPFSFLLRNLVN